jgi:hypothetical protein
MGVPKAFISDAKSFVTKHCIERLKNKDKTVRNMEFWLFAEHENSEEILRFLKQVESRKDAGYPVLFEVDYALDVCRRKAEEFQEIYDAEEMPGSTRGGKILAKINTMKKAQIKLYGILNLYSKAVKLALECKDIELAQEYANKPSELKIKKKLWMKIAKYLFNYQNP